MNIDEYINLVEEDSEEISERSSKSLRHGL